MILYKPEIIKNNLINPIYSSFLSKFSIPVTTSSYTGTFTYELSGNESKWVEDVKFNNREVIIIPKEKIEDRTYIECIDYDIKKEICLKEQQTIYSIPDTMPVKTLNEDSLTDISKEQKELETKPTDVFIYNIPLDVHELKIGENSVTITELQVTTQSNLINITAETGNSNFTHLTINNLSTNVPYNNLTAYYPFDGDKENGADLTTNTSTFTVYDFSGNNRDGISKARAYVNSTGCVYGDCAKFDGNGTAGWRSYIELTNKWTFRNDSMTISLWANPKTGQASTIDARMITSANECVFRYNNNAAEFILNSFATNDRVLSPANTFPANTWTHVVGMYDKVTNNMTMWINGVYVNSTIPTGYYALCSSWQLGAYNAVSGGYYNGSIDEVMVFNTSLTSAQILAIYNNQSARFLATGTQNIINQSYMNISTGNNRVNVTTYIENNLGSSINLSVGYYDVSAIWGYTSPQVVSSGINQTFIISSTSTNLTLNYTFYAGNSTNPFYSPIIKSNITYEVWNEAEDTIYPSFSSYYDNNATLLNNGMGYFNVVVKNTNGTVILHINNTNIYATLGCKDEPGFYVAPYFYTCSSISDETACLEQSNCNWDGACQTITYPFCSSFQSQATCEGSSQIDVCTWNYGTSYEFTNSGTYIYNWTSYGNGTSHNINISSNRNYLVNSSITNCWTKTGNILYVPKGCVFQLNKGSIYEI